MSNIEGQPVSPNGGEQKIESENDIYLDGDDAECNECGWKGNPKDMCDEMDEDDDFESVCPECGSSNIYYFR